MASGFLLIGMPYYFNYRYSYVKGIQLAIDGKCKLLVQLNISLSTIILSIVNKSAMCKPIIINYVLSSMYIEVW